MHKQLHPHPSSTALPKPLRFPLKTAAKLSFYILIAWQYSQLFWLGEKNIAIDRAHIYGTQVRPYVFRQLVPLLARFLVWGTRIREDLALVLAVAFSGVAAGIAIGIWLREFRVEKTDFYELIGVGILFTILVKDAKIYDFATVATFILCLVLLHRRAFWPFHLVYLLACLNRETAFLLTIFFVYHFFHKLDRKTYITHFLIQLLIFLSVRLTMMYLFSSNPGTNIQFNLFGNIQEFANNPIESLIVIAIFISIFYFVARRWQDVPKFLKDVILIFTPPLFVSWILLGRAFELRVFIELFPALLVAMVVPRKYLNELTSAS